MPLLFLLTDFCLYIIMFKIIKRRNHGKYTHHKANLIFEDKYILNWIILKSNTILYPLGLFILFPQAAAV